MAERIVGLKIKVDDSEVKQGEASVRRLQNAANNQTSAFGGRNPQESEEQQRRLKNFMGNEMPQAAQQAKAAVEELGSATAEGEEGFLAMASAGGGAVGVLGSVAGAAAVVAAGIVVLAKVSFDLSSAFSKAAIEAGNLAEETGLAVETITALRAEADAQGRSFDMITSAAQSFRKTIGEAAAGSKEAAAGLRAVGLTKDAIYDVDGAFKQVLETVSKTSGESEKIKLLFAVFGDDGPKMLDFLKDSGGDVDKTIQKFRELGVVMSGEDAAAAREFNRELEEVKAIVQGLVLTFGRELLPVVHDVLEDFNQFVAVNKGNVGEWARGVADSVRDVVDALTNLKALVTAPTWEEGLFRFLGTVMPNSPYGIGLNAMNQGARNQGLRGRMGGSLFDVDAGATSAMLGYEPKKEKETEAEKQAKALRDIITDLNNKIQFYGDKSHVAAIMQKLLAMGILDVNKSLAEQAKWLAGVLDQKDKNAEIDKRNAQWTMDFEKQKLEWSKRYADESKAIQSRGFSDRLGVTAEWTAIRKELDLKRELTGVEQYAVKMVQEQLAYREKLRADGVYRTVIEQKVAELIGEQLKTLTLISQLDEDKRELFNRKQEKAADDYLQSLRDELDATMRNGRELTVYEQVLREVERTTNEAVKAKKDDLLAIAAQTDAVRELNRQHAELKAFFSEGLRYAFEGNFTGLFENWGDRIKDSLADKLGDIFATSLLGFDPRKTNNPVAKPIVEKLDETNQILRSMATGSGGAAAAAGVGGNGLSGIIRNILGGGGSTAPFNPNGSGGVPPTGTIDANGNYVVNGNESSGGGIFGNLKKLFSTGEGGIFAPRGGSKAAGIMGGIGDLATIAGGMIGGRTGSVISMIGTGASMGSMFGLPGAIIGAGIGAVVGLFSALFGRNQQRRRDEQTRNQGMLDAQAAIKREFDAISTQLRFGQIDPASAIIRGTSVGDQVRNQYLQMANSLQDSKTRRIAVADVSRVDALIAQKMAELRGLAEVADSSAERMKRILPEFAGGHYFADYFRPNGLLPGMFDGADNIFAMISRGEMVLNPQQMANVRRNAGFDVFAGAGIPNYPKANPSTHLATGGIVSNGLSLAQSAPQIIVQPRMSLYLEGVTFGDNVKAYLESDDGSRVIVDVYKSKKDSGDIS